MSVLDLSLVSICILLHTPEADLFQFPKLDSGGSERQHSHHTPELDLTSWSTFFESQIFISPGWRRCGEALPDVAWVDVDIVEARVNVSVEALLNQTWYWRTAEWGLVGCWWNCSITVALGRSLWDGCSEMVVLGQLLQGYSKTVAPGQLL